jgi:hypothetical protein
MLAFGRFCRHFDSRHFGDFGDFVDILTVGNVEVDFKTQHLAKTSATDTFFLEKAKRVKAIVERARFFLHKFDPT